MRAERRNEQCRGARRAAPHRKIIRQAIKAPKQFVSSTHTLEL